MTLADILATCYGRCSYAPDPPSEIQTLFTGHVNETQQELASDPSLQALLRGATLLTTVADQPEYGLPPSVSRILSIRETANNRRLVAVSLDSYRRMVPDPAQVSGTADAYALLGPIAVAQQPSAAAQLFVVSSSVADLETLHVEVVTTGGYTRTTTATLSGTTAVGLTILDAESVIDWYLDAPAQGVVALLEGSAAGPELGRIGIGGTRVRYQGIAFLPTPSDARVYRLDHERTVTDLVTPQDAPTWLPEQFHRLLSMGARRRYWEDKREADRYTAAVSDWNATLARLRAFVNNPPDQTLIPGGPRSERSNLGGMFPPTSLLN